MTMMAATATTLMPSMIQKPLERTPSVISRLATRATGRSRSHRSRHAGSALVVGVSAVSSSAAADEFEEHLGEGAPLEPEAA